MSLWFSKGLKWGVTIAFLTSASVVEAQSVGGLPGIAPLQGAGRWGCDPGLRA